MTSSSVDFSNYKTQMISYKESYSNRALSHRSEYRSRYSLPESTRWPESASKSLNYRSRSPHSMKSHVDNNEYYKSPSRCLGVFGLSCHTSSNDLRRVFAKFGPLEDARVVNSAGSGFSSAFGYVHFIRVKDAVKVYFFLL